jgi:FMN phosphatase YigB (HAD superfamily)
MINDCLFQVIHKTFTPLIKKDQVLPKNLAPRLLHRFSSHEGYEAEPNLKSSLKALRSQRHFDNIVIGVITNSDDRVPSVLSSFGLNVSPLRYGMEVKDPPSALASRHYDIDFHCMSYDVGVEKPDKLIFTAAERMLARVLSLRDGKSHIDADEADVDETWRKVYVGDDYAKDVVGAVNAGWNPVLFGTAEQAPSNVPRLEDYPDRTLDDMFREHAVTRVDSLQNLARWFVGGVN